MVLKAVLNVNRIRELRLEREKAQKEIAIDLGVTQATVSSWEKGIKIPSAKSTVKLAKYFDVSVEYLLGLTDENSPHAEISEEALDAELITRLKALSPEDLAKVDSYVQWILATREAPASPPAEGRK